MTRSTLFSSTATKGGTGLTLLLLLFLALIHLPSTAHATYALPASQSVDWTIPYIGVRGDIPARTTVYTTLSPSGGDDTSAIQTALKSCPAGQVVALKAGTFTISANINIPSNVTLRGAGKGVTTIAGASGMGGSSLISLGNGGGYGGTSYTSASLAKGQTTVTLNASPGWSVGTLVLIDVANSAVTETTVTNVGNNGTCSWCGRASGTRSMGQVNRVAAISGSTVTFETPLAWNFPPSATQFTSVNSVTSNAGLENLSVNNQSSGSSSQTGNGGTVVMHNSSNCWLLGVELNGSWLTMLRMSNTYGCTVRKCNLHEGVPAAFSPGCAAYQTSRAYGIWIGPGSNNLIEDNQLYHLAMPIKYDEPTSYNVLAYNVITNILYSPNPGWNQASIEFHGAHPVMNLFESNIVTGRLLADSVWGSSSHNTFFRNKTAISSSMTGALWDVCLQSNARNYNFIGNVLGTSRDESVYQINNMTVPSGRAIYQTGYTSDGDSSASGNDANVATTLLTHGNWDSVTGGAKWLSGADQVLPASLYLKSMPSWWGSAPWPAIGPDVSPTFPTDAYSLPLGGANTPFDSGTQSTTPTTYSISAGSTSGGSITPSGTTTVNAGASQSYAITPLSGYSISALSVDGAPVGAVSSYTFSSVGANHTISASFAAIPPVTYSIAASAGTGGSITPSGSATVTSGGSATYSIAPAAGYKISSVTVDGVSVGAVSSYTFSNVTANHSISATFAVTSYSITASAGTGGTITPSGTATLAPGGSATYNVAPAIGYTLSSVVVDGASVGAVTSYTFSNVTANHTIQANFVAKTFTLTASAGAGGSITPSGTVSVTQGSTATFTMTPATGYKISSVSVDGTSVGAVTSYTFSSIGLNHTISATFAPVTYTITASAGTGGSITPSGASSVTAGSAQTYSITPATGYKISGVTVDGVSVGAVSSYSFSSVAANHSIAASFSASTTSASYAVNSAGAKYTDASGLVYNADANFSGGSVGTTTATISNTADQTLYQSERYGNFSYSIPVTNGSYNVTLKFAEGYFSAAGQRVFNVAVNGTTVISNLDIYAKVGKNTAYDVVVPATVSNGTLTIQFSSVVNNAEIRAIKVVPSTTSTAPVFAVDAGGASYKAASGVTYAADSNYTGGSVGTTTATITGTNDGTLYQSERYGNFTYNVPVSNGTHNVTLKFAEGYFSAAGQRVFSVSANGSTVISNLDLFAKAGKNAAYDVTFPVNVTNGAISLSFVPSVNNAEVRGILIQ